MAADIDLGGGGSTFLPFTCARRLVTCLSTRYNKVVGGGVGSGFIYNTELHVFQSALGTRTACSCFPPVPR